MTRETARSDRQAIWILTILYFLLFLFLFTPWMGTGGDPCFYYAYLSSFLFDGDLEFANDLLASNNHVQYSVGMATLLTQNGYTQNVYAPGIAVLAAPFMLAAFVVARLAELAGAIGPIDRYGFLFCATISLAGLWYGYAGILLLYRICRRWFSPLISAGAAFVTFASSPVLYYAMKEGAMSHVYSYFAVALFLYLTLRGRRRPYYVNAFYYGLAGGLMVLTRWQCAVFLIVPVASNVPRLISCFSRHRSVFLAYELYKLGCFLAGFILVLSLQMVIWYVIYGQLLIIPQGEQFLRWAKPQFAKLLFSGWNGLFSSSPFLLLSVLGLAYLLKRRTYVGIGLVGAALAMIYVNAAVSDWFAGTSFGARRFCALLPILTLGSAGTVRWLQAKFRTWTIVLILVLFSLVNVFLVILFSRGIIRYYFFGHHGYEWWLLLRHSVRNPLAFWGDSLMIQYLEQGRHVLLALGLVALGLVGMLGVMVVGRSSRWRMLFFKKPILPVVAISAILCLDVFFLVRNPRLYPAGKILRDALEAKKEGDIGGAQELLERAQRLYPQNSLIKYELGLLAQEQNLPAVFHTILSEAILSKEKFIVAAILLEGLLPPGVKMEAVRMAHDKYYTHPMISGNMIYIYLWAKMSDEAQRRLKKSHIVNPEYSFLWHRIAEQGAKKGAAIEYIQAVLRFDPTNLMALNMMRDYAEQQGERALTEYFNRRIERILKSRLALLRRVTPRYREEGEHWGAEYSQAAQSLADHYLHLDRLDDAQNVLSPLKSLAGFEQTVQRKLLQIEFRKAQEERDDASAQRTVEQLTSVHSDEPYAYIYAAEFYLAKGNLKRALDLITTAWPQTPRVPEFNTLFRKILFAPALNSTLLAEASAHEISHAGFYLTLGDKLLLLGNYPEAIRYYEKSLDLLPELTDAYFGLGIAFYHVSLLDSAVNALEQATRLDPMRARSYLYLGYCYEARKEQAKAEAAYLQAYVLDPANAQIRTKAEETGLAQTL
jgi:tetratricopeptide (TPR) repeat protein